MVLRLFHTLFHLVLTLFHLRVHALGGDNQLAFRKGCKVTKERLTN